jgi:N-acetylglucosamine malate deacetylase 1
MKVLVIAPHPDDETLGCGSTLLKHKFEGDDVYWLIITDISIEDGWKEKIVKKRKDEIKQVGEKYGFTKVFNLQFSTTKVDTLSTSTLIEKVSTVYNLINPNIIYMPFVSDVHTDHQVIAKALGSTLKWFRYPYINKVYMYETPSETDFNFLSNRLFRPNVYVDASIYLQNKIKIMNIYKGEMKEFPFPRSEKSIRALATLRGSQSGFNAAEAFELVYEKRK